MTEERRQPSSLMEDLDYHGYKLNAEGTVWIAPKRMIQGCEFKPPRPVNLKKEITQRPVTAREGMALQRLSAAVRKEEVIHPIKVEYWDEDEDEAEPEAEPEPEPFGYRFNDDGTFFGK